MDKVLEGKEHTTLYTDETRKYGKCIQTYVLTDETQTSYILGLREMFNKSGQSTLDTFKDILNDINDHCYQAEKNSDMHVGYQILANIRDTMSDRASTEKTFNSLLEQFRNDILPDVIDNWNELNEKQKTLCSKMNNFFCGLHLLVGLADSCEESLKKFERLFMDGKDIGSAIQPELKRYHKHESGILRLIRTACKCFAIGEDEKNGVSSYWKTFLNEKSEKNRFIRFKHNRFNLVFVLGYAVYYHHEDISIFLDTVHGTKNDLLKAVSLNIKEKLFLAGAKALGLISKFITGPLWRILEGKGHILDMNHHYQSLIEFLHKGATNVDDISKFLIGENTPFDTSIDTEDPLFVHLTKNVEIDEIVCPLLQSLFQTMSTLLQKMVMDHLPGGKFWDPSGGLIEESKSTMTHNKLPEFVFGQLDQLLRYRPNSTLLANESYLLYSHNKTGKWLDSLSEVERNLMIDKSRKEGVEIRKNFKLRLLEIERKHLEDMKKKQEDLVRKEKKRLKDAENITNNVCFYGLWQSPLQVDEGLGRMPENEQRKALESQLKFRKTVLKQRHSETKIFNFSRKNERGKYEKFSLAELKENVLTLIKDTLKEITTEKNQTNIPLFVGKNIEHLFSDGVKYCGHVISVVPGFPKWYNSNTKMMKQFMHLIYVQIMRRGRLIF